MPIGSDARFPLNTDPSIVPAQPAVSQVPLAMAAQPGSPAASPTPAQPPQPGSFWGFLNSLFNRGALGQGPPQGMRGLLQPPQPMGQRRPGTDTLGNPLGRF